MTTITVARRRAPSALPCSPPASRSSAIHLLDLALSGPDTSLIGVAAIVAVPLAALWAPNQPRVDATDPRSRSASSVGLVFAAFGIASHGLHAVGCRDRAGTT